MKAFLEKIDKDYLDDFVYISKHQLLNRGIDVVDFDGTDLLSLERKNPRLGDICIGSVEACTKFFELVGIKTPNYIGYPNELLPFYGRKIWSCEFSEIDKFPIFIKPKNGVKLFTGTVLESEKDKKLISSLYTNINDGTEIFCSETIDIISEWRCFVNKGDLKGIHWYDGDFKEFLTKEMVDTINDMISSYKTSPISYTLDVGIVNNGLSKKIILIEVNDFWAIGSYGFNSKEYVRMTVDRFNEIKNENRIN